MKILRIVLAILLAFSATGFAFSQNKSSKEKEKNAELKPVAVFANMLVSDAQNKYDDELKKEDIKIFEDEVEQKLTYFARKEPVLNLGLAVDNTGSMRILLDQISTSGSVIVNNLGAGDETFLVRFVSSDKIEILVDWTSNQGLLKRGMVNLFIEGGQSAIIDAVYLSAQKILKREKENSSKRYALVLLTDGEDRDSFYKIESLFSLLKGSEMQIFVLAFTGSLAKRIKDRSEAFVNQLAFQTGGAAYFLKESFSKNRETELVEILKSLLTELRSNYIVGYTSTNQNRDGLARKLRVEIADSEKGEKRQGLIRTSFVVPKE